MTASHDLMFRGNPAWGEGTSRPAAQFESLEPRLLLSAVQIGLPDFVDEGGTATLTGTLDGSSSGPHTVQIDWGDGSSDTLNLLAGVDVFSVDHPYLDDDPTGTPADDYSVLVTVVDDVGGETTAGAIVTVNNVAPVIGELTSSAASLGDVAEGETVEITGSFTDVGTLDTHTAVIDWGDGTTSAAVVDEDAGAGSLSASHVYAAGGIYEIQVTLTDDDTGGDAAAAAAVISGAGVHDGVLQIIGTRGNDRVKINQQGNGTMKVHAGFLNARGKQRSFDAADIEKIVILLGDGNDRAQLSGNIDLITLIDGGGGNDHIKAGGGPSVLLGSDGNDRLIGGSNNDMLVGGEGRDRLVGGPGEDILIGGSTVFDVDDEALTASFAEPLLAILAEWNAGTDQATRKANIDGTSGGAGLNGVSYLQVGTTVIDDNAQDKITGSSGEDWYVEGSDKALKRLQQQQARDARKAARLQRQQDRQQARDARRATGAQRQQERRDAREARKAAND